MEIILTHDNADFDAVASLVAAHKLYETATPILPKKQQANVQEFLHLYGGGLPLTQWDDFKQGAEVTRIILTDTFRRPSLKNLPDAVPTYIIDHHTLDRELHDYEEWAGDNLGSATTLVIEKIRAKKIDLTTLEATLFALGIYADTGNFTYGGTTPRDIDSAAWLLRQGAVLDTIKRFLTHPLNDEQHQLFKTLLAQMDSREVNGYDVTICTAKLDDVLSNINTVVGAIRNIVDADAVIVLVDMPDHVQLIGRSTHDAIDVGYLARQFEGGGHPRAAASAISGANLETVRDDVWQYLHEAIKPAVRIADIMSFGDVQTVTPDEKIDDIIGRLRLVGHEGYPVLDDNHIIGLLTLRDADKALEHGLKQSTVRDVMMTGSHSLTPDDPIARLEEVMIESDWGQIPIIGQGQSLVGIVTRTDLIKYWGQKHPNTVIPAPEKVDSHTVKTILGADNATLIQTIANFAQKRGIYLYMVGGVVRDLLLKRPNYDIDFVLEQDAIEFAESLQAEFGGNVHPYPPFRTATWSFDVESAEKLGVSLDAIPEYIDFATARNELYQQPTALPTVFNSSIKLDLRRRDFTINTLAIQQSPERSQWQILDFYGGLQDLEQGVIRVLHSLSFSDDPTRILRAVRFSERLGFTIETGTVDLIHSALPMLKRITGERLQNELSLILKEPNPARGVLKLQALGVLSHIHPDFEVTSAIEVSFAKLAKNEHPQWAENDVWLKWHLLMAQLEPDAVTKVTEILLFGRNRSKAMQQTSELYHNRQRLIADKMRPSQIVKQLDPVTDISVLAVWLSADDAVRDVLETYQTVWCDIQPTVTGHTLKQMGLKPGAEYRVILQRLRDAWLDEKITNEDEEQKLLSQLISEVYS